LRVLLGISRGIDWINDQFGVVATWFVLLAALVAAFNSILSYLLGPVAWLMTNYPFTGFLQPIFTFYQTNSNGMLEAQWYMFAGMVLFGAAYTFKVNEHIRVDLFYEMYSERGRMWVDILGGIFFLLPMCAVLIYFTWPWFLDAWRSGEASGNAGGLVRWPVKLVLPLGFALVGLQGISEIIKRIEALIAHHKLQYEYETPLQ